jgi:anti-sigma factor RsiW
MSEHNPIEDELTAYVDGELPELDMQRVKAAIEKDPKLAALEQVLRSTITAVEALPSPLPSQALRRAVLNGLDAPMTMSERLQKWLRPSRLMPALGMAAAAALVAVIAQQGAQVSAPHEAEEEQLYVAQNLEVLEDLELAGLESAEDLEVIAALDSLEATP